MATTEATTTTEETTTPAAPVNPLDLVVAIDKFVLPGDILIYSFIK